MLSLDQQCVSLKQNKKKLLIVGITGPTRCGKTTLASNLQKKLQISQDYIIKQDDFFNIYKIEKELNSNWEVPEAIDQDKFLQKIEQSIKKANENQEKFILIEGFLILSDQRIREIIDVALWIQISDNEIYYRRLSNIQWEWLDTPEYVSNVILPEYHSYFNQYSSFSKVKMLNGMNSQNDLTCQSLLIISALQYN